LAQRVSVCIVCSGEFAPEGHVRWTKDGHDIVRCLRPGGVLALSTGDAAPLAARLSGSRWHLLTPRHHNFFFTAATLSRLLGRSGFDVVTLDHRGSRYPLRYLVHKLRTLVPLRALDTLTGRLAQGRLGAVALPVNLWDIVTVVARRAPQ
jgi:hypothetical protein